jgi:hypothetical protein
LKVRQPLAQVLVPVLQESVREQIRRVEDLIKSEVNVKMVNYLDDASGVLSKKVKPNFKALGPKFGKDMKAVADVITGMSASDLATIEAAGAANLHGFDIAIADIEILTEDMPGYLTASEAGMTIALDNTLTPELVSEGMAREFQVDEFGLRILATLRLGFWGLRITRDTLAKSKLTQEWDFSICVKAGDNFCLHPGEAKNKILRYHSESVYSKWKKTVLEDLPRFATAIEALNPPRHIFSTTCSRSSERVCRKLNLHVSEGRAFMLHNPSKKCLHKAGTFIP